MKRCAGLMLIVAISLSIMVMGCRKKAASVATSSSESAPANAPAARAAPQPAATPAAGGETGASVDTTAKLAAADWAIKQDQIKNDPAGQWAVSATASSSYNDAKEEEDYAPNQTAGAPNVEAYGDDARSWAPKTADSGLEWLELTFAKAVPATEVRIRESCGSGAIIRIELIDEQGTSHAVWSGADPTKDLNYLILKFPKTAYKVSRVKVTLATNAVTGWNEIDAVQLVGTEG